MPGAFIAAVAGIVPILAVHIAYAISIKEGFSPTCFPYIEGCTSISAAARNGNALFLFRGLIIPCSIIMVAYWRLVQLWLTSIDQEPSKHKAILYLGATGSLFLILYADYLGSSGEAYRWMRRYGIFMFFGLTPLAQLLQVRALLRISQFNSFVAAQIHLVRWQAGFCLIMLVCGVISVTADWLGLKTHELGNALEWVFAWFIFNYFLITALLWSRSGVGFSVTSNC